MRIVLLQTPDQGRTRIGTRNRLQEQIPIEETFSRPEEPIPIEARGLQHEPDPITLDRDEVVVMFRLRGQEAIQIIQHLHALVLHPLQR